MRISSEGLCLPGPRPKKDNGLLSNDLDLSKSTPEVRKLLIDLDEHKSTRTRIQAAERLGELKPPEAVEWLAYCLTDDEDLDVKTAATMALAEIGDPRACRVIIRALQGHGYTAGIHALGLIGDPIAIRPLIGYLVDRYSWAFQPAVTALANIGEATIPALTEAINDKISDVRLGATRALGEIGISYETARVVAPLTSRWKDEEEIRFTAINGLAALGELAEGAVLKMLEGGEKRRLFAKAVMEAGQTARGHS